MDIYNLAILTVQALPQHFDPALKFFLYFLFVKQFLNFPLHMRRTFFFPPCAVTGSIQLYNRITNTKNMIIFICKKIQSFLSLIIKLNSPIFKSEKKKQQNKLSNKCRCFLFKSCKFSSIPYLHLSASVNLFTTTTDLKVPFLYMS